MKIKVEAKIKVTVGDTELKLTRADAENLCFMLKAALGEKEDPYKLYPPGSVPTVWHDPLTPPWEITSNLCTLPDDAILSFNSGASQ